MSARDTILNAVRNNSPKAEYTLPELPIFSLNDGGDRTSFFLDNVEKMGGKYFAGSLVSALRTGFPDAVVIASAAPELTGTKDLTTVLHPRDLADVDVTVVRAAFAIAETGSVLLIDDDLQINAVAYLAQHLIVLVDPADILLTTQEAYLRPEFARRHYCVFHTGPSATADIEGVLIHGAQGVRSLTVVMSARS